MMYHHSYTHNLSSCKIKEKSHNIKNCGNISSRPEIVGTFISSEKKNSKRKRVKRRQNKKMDLRMKLRCTNGHQHQQVALQVSQWLS